MGHRRLWFALVLVIAGSFSVLGYYGFEIRRGAPPVPDRVVTADGNVLYTRADILDGQSVWQSIGGQEVGSVWGHGGYVAPDWSADFLHREAIWMLDERSGAEYGVAYAELAAPERARLEAMLAQEVRENTYDPETGDLVVSPARVRAIRAVAGHYESLFGTDPDPELVALRKAYALPAGAIPEAERRRLLCAFFFWTSWACSTERPGSKATYSNNWPAEDLIGNRPTGATLVWSIASFVFLLAGVGALSWYFAVQKHRQGPEDVSIPDADPLLGLDPTPSMRATRKYFWVVASLLVTQIGLGALTAHYGVEGDGFFGIPLDKWLPYAVTRTWHTQLGLFWIATAWLATGLFIAPAVSGHEPRGQRLGVNVLFGALLVVVVGSLAGEWFSIQQKLGLSTGFWFGHQGYEYVDLGRFWQILLFGGLLFWFFLVARALLPAFRKPGEHRHLLALFLVASGAIGLFYGAGLMWGRHTNLAVAEYWRWWVVHLWVEGFFEVFATVVIGFLFCRMGLLGIRSTTSAVLFSTTIFLTGGILGTMHHLYFTGTSTAVLALGATFSALEIVPLVLIGFEAYENLTLSRAKAWVSAYRWPIYFFVAVAFWNLVGAGLFGFLINPPIALYYVQGLNTTPVHGHTALFGVYGMLGIGLLLFCLKGLSAPREWRTGALSFSFWSLNGGLVLMVLLSLLPIGLIQAWASVEHGLWYARSAEFLQTPLLQTLRWLRAPGDTVFALGALALAWFVLGLVTGWSYRREGSGSQPVPAGAGRPALEEVGATKD